MNNDLQEMTEIKKKVGLIGVFIITYINQYFGISI